ncbi:MAG: hypothetical protein V3U63_00805, partial [Gemmatimonadota bacterium]
MRRGTQCYLIASVLAAGPGSARTAVAQDDWDEAAVEIHGFVEAATASRVTGDPTQPDDFLLGEARFRLDLSHYEGRADLSFKGDFTADRLRDEVEIDIRQASITLGLAEWLDLRAGRQVLTWGTGDFVFLNDLFPKDFVSFFIGRADEFLKAPSNSLKLTFYSEPANLDIVWTPIFDPDRFITGERLSFFDKSTGASASVTTMGQPLQSVLPARQLEDGELAGRLFRTIGGYELALYGYVGFTKQPLAFDEEANLPAHSRLRVYGASARGAFVGGIANVEWAYYNSADDEGSDPNVPNSQLRGLVGYEHELVANLGVGLQYYLEWIQDYDTLIANSGTPQFERDELRHTITSRLTYRLLQETLTLSLFAFVSPSDEDTHLRPSLSYKWTDAVTIAAGGNIMLGDETGFFGQLEDNTNAYLR